ncbi:hypothetical protein ACS0TY_012017 [Phlomoides rotata]
MHGTIKSRFLACLIVLALFIIVSNLAGHNEHLLEDQKPQIKHINIKEGISVSESCNLFSGRWVYDDVSYPLYKEAQCSFMLNDFTNFACEKYGRKDVKYQNWRWQPHDCDLPRFDGTKLLEKISGKRLVFVGDSLGRNQWASMLCLIESSLPQLSSQMSFIRNDNLFIFHATEYNATIEYYWSPFLVESNCDDPFNHSIKLERIIRISDIEKHARHWTNADILIFDAHMWWRHPTMMLLWGSFGSSDAIYKRVEMKFRRFEMALNTWSDWLQININRTKTKLFFTSLMPNHFNVESSGGIQKNCYTETEPVLKEGYWGNETDLEMMHVAESVIRKLETRGVKVEYLNITNLSDYRKDGHPSIYKKLFHHLSEKQIANPERYADCVHWCLPGVPDVWNEILYSYIINPL